MTQEEKDLLLKDICERLPYGVKLLYNSNSIANIKDRVEILRGITIGYTIWFETNYDHYEYESTSGSYEHFKPYLRKMSSITKEEMDELNELCGGIVWTKDILHDEVLNIYYRHDALDWLLKHHFDTRGLIEKGLALEAPEGMYND